MLNWQTVQSNDLPKLKADECHLWWLPLSLDSQQQQETLKLLNPVQMSKYHRRKNDDLKHYYLAGRHHLFRLLAHYNQCSPQSLQLSYSRLNKPALQPNPNNIEFNFTDTYFADQAHALYAFSYNHSLGVDLEAINRVANFEKIAEQRFTKNELDYVTQNGEINAQRFLAIWTRKEAFGKATGQGINFKMNEIDLIDEQAFTKQFSIEQQTWRLHQIQINTSHIACVVHQGETKLKLKSYTF